MTSTRSLGSQLRWRQWTGRLWVLAGVLGLSAIVSVMVAIHDTSLRRQAETLVAVTTAQQIAQAAHAALATMQPSIADLPVDSARHVAAAIFGDIIRADSALARLDSQSVLVTKRDGTVLFGSLDSAHRVRAALEPHDPRSLRIAVALASYQIPHVLLMPLRVNVLWHGGVLLLATIVVITLAFGSSRREAALANARGDFIAGVSHDLRMPLAQILLAGETLTLRDDLDTAERSSLSHSIVRESKRLIGLIENLLLFSRSGAAELSPRRDIVPAADLIRDVVEAVRLAIEDAGQSIITSTEDSLAIVGDARLLRQALLNLVDNAIKYGPRGQRISMEAHRVDGRVRITIDDAGPGIPKAERERVFEAYERLWRDQSSERTGTGLGLSVVAYIIRASEGRAWFDDAANGGTRAVVELPSAGAVG